MTQKKISESLKTKIRNNIKRILDEGKPVVKAQLAKKFDVSARTIGRIFDQVSGNTQPTSEPKKKPSKTKKAKSNKPSKPKEPKPKVTTEVVVDSGEVDYSTLKYMNTNQSLTMYLGDEEVAISADSPTHREVVLAILDGDMERAWKLGNVRSAISVFTDGAITVEGETVKMCGVELDNRLQPVQRIIDMLKNGAAEEELKAFAGFMTSLFDLPDTRIVDELYSFIQHMDIELEADGSFIGYKAVRSDYTDKHTGTFDNSVGTMVSMPRGEVDNDKNRTCSSGLHVGSIKYVRGFANINDRIVKCRVYARDVVSVPVDYNGQKLRACRYEVIEDVTDKTKY